MQTDVWLFAQLRNQALCGDIANNPASGRGVNIAKRASSSRGVDTAKKALRGKGE